MLYRIAVLALLPLAGAFSIPAVAPARPAVSPELSTAHALVNRDLMTEDPEASPPAPRMELVDMQRLDMELYDMEMRMCEEWEERLMQEGGLGDDAPFADADSLLASAYLRS